MNMRPLQFLWLDLAGASLYTGVFAGAGYVFSDFLSVITRGYTAFGSAAGWATLAAVAAYLGWRAALAFRTRYVNPVPMLSVQEVAARRSSLMIVDVRSHGYYEKGTMRIEGSVRLEPNAAGYGSELMEGLPDGKSVVLYCTCAGDVTSTKVARILAERGISAVVMEGGLGGWKKAGLPLEMVPENEVVALPTFS